jgi:hypothetical protein
MESMERNLFSPWYSWKNIAHLALINNRNTIIQTDQSNINIYLISSIVSSICLDLLVYLLPKDFYFKVFSFPVVLTFECTW